MKTTATELKTSRKYIPRLNPADRKQSLVKRNKKVAQGRGEKWRKNMIAGRLKANANPSEMRLIRSKKGLHQEDVAKSLGVSKGYYAAIEKGFRNATLDMAKSISKILGSGIGQLFKKVDSTHLVALISS